MHTVELERLKARKGARKRSEIPNEVLSALNQGKIETVNLVEWLAIDMPFLLRNSLTEIGWEEQIDHLYDQSLKLQDQGITKRLKGIGTILFQALEEEENRTEIFERLASHTSDMVRAWAAFSIAADETLSLPERLEIMRRFATDGSFSVRECAWDALRSYLVDDLAYSFELLTEWVKDEDPNIRRCAVEATRPRGVWCKHIPTLKKNPDPGLTILEFVRSDPSNYVQRSVGNWLNDASKSTPDWVINTCLRWRKESPTKETSWIIKHALRTLKKHNTLSQKLQLIAIN
ncbi:DNA alkylation repair protein [Moorena sp. SIO3B2]|uniref:DNA alkylation repair protein n=1 Tax=Moorena sp. SIO3B2 TaxID=2607827 RepID=UPI0013C75392|nr:DNA alkylation repair protein [Moorena sp. SIO3B2]NEP35743.1 DNA alkylation repair protein [Moorena sp. SIO3B2]